MMTQEHAEIGHILDAAAQVIDDHMTSVTPARSVFFQALNALQTGDVPEATRLFRTASRTAEPPFDTLAQNALAECERNSGREGAALRAWRKVANQKDAPHAARYMAWMSIAALEEARGDKKAVEKALDALDALGEPTNLPTAHTQNAQK